MTASEFAAQLDARRNGDGWIARCPAHDDRRASLSIGSGDGNNVVITCHAGCTAEAIVTVMGLTMADLFPDGEEGARPRLVHSNIRTVGATLETHCVRMRRDFRQLLTTIQTVAFLYQCQRQRTCTGWVEATIEDYLIARQLLESAFDAVAGESVTPVVRATVEAVKAGEEISETALAQRLKLSIGRPVQCFSRTSQLVMTSRG